MSLSVRIKKKSSRKSKRSKVKQRELIIIDESKGMIFKSEKDLFTFFSKAIEKVEREYNHAVSPEDFTSTEQETLEALLEETLEMPDAVYRDSEFLAEFSCHFFIKNFEEQNLHYIAICYVNSADEMPTFVFFHFATKDPTLVKRYQRGELIYDVSFEEALPGAIEGDALSEGDFLALGLYRAMMKVRTSSDIPQEKFVEFASLRGETIEEADEIWRKVDVNGNILVTFIREFPDHEAGDLTYLAVTVEDDSSHTHALLFSFPTIDSSLVDRYRRGENLQAEDVVHESSH